MIAVLTLMARAFLSLTGWTVRNDVPPSVQKCVIVAAPHTSNWDFPYTLAVARMLDMKFYWVGKHTLFKGPLGPIMRALGGIPVDRRKSQNFVQQIAQAMQAADAMAVAMAPEGTRSKTEFWKSGFYYIAREAGVPVVLGFLDFRAKVGGLGPIIDPERSKREVMDDIRAFYDGIEGQRHHLYTSPKLRDETDDL